MGFTRLIDVKDVEKHWDYIENGMRSLPNSKSNNNNNCKFLIFF
jgi:hypothetical protein